MSGLSPESVRLDASGSAFAQSQADFDYAMWQSALERLDASRVEFRDAVGLLTQFLTAMRMEGSNGPLTEFAWRRTERAMREWGLETAL